MIGSPWPKPALNPWSRRYRRYADTGHSALQLNLGEPEIAFGAERGIDRVDALGRVRHKIEYADQHTVVELELFFGNAIRERYECVTHVSGKIVRAAIGKPRSPHVGTRVHAGLACEAFEPSGMDIEALRDCSRLKTVGPDRRRWQIR